MTPEQKEQWDRWHHQRQLAESRCMNLVRYLRKGIGDYAQGLGRFRPSILEATTIKELGLELLKQTVEVNELTKSIERMRNEVKK